MRTTPTLFDRLDHTVFNAVHSRSLVLTAGEDAAVDHTALKLQFDDNSFVIASAGCNRLGFAPYLPYPAAPLYWFLGVKD